ncbi:hypothetical protein PF002_g28048 [Phytophthora fragariae]|uniref:Uncharacterized protein n=1 Tax=Phytophthora fragariae TaxID=53985 RepID=A0A6A3W5H2_9STRA|nr:hypothetical protein PF002_g28048 [Phytophthora fragariae]
MNGFASAVALILLAIQVTNAGFVKTAGTALRYTYYYTGTTARHRSQKAYESNHAGVKFVVPLVNSWDYGGTDVYVKQLGRALHQRKGEGCVKEVHRHLRQQIQGGRHHHDLGAMQRMPAASVLGEACLNRNLARCLCRRGRSELMTGKKAGKPVPVVMEEYGVKPHNASVYEAWRDAVSVVGSNMQYWEFCLKPLSLRVHIFGTDEIFKSAIVPAAKKFKTPA